LGALLCAAVGDAMGLPFAGMYPEEIEDEWGVVDEVDLPDGASVSPGGDYTALMLLTLESLAARGRLHGADTVRRRAAWAGPAKIRNTAKSKAASA
jgi:ADP-ribosylglycohydrolase